jgi:hypothetical protein
MYVLRDLRFSKDTPYYPATSQEEDDFNLFPLPSSSYYDQNVCSLPQQVPEVPEFSLLLINLLPPLLWIFWVHVQHLMFFSPV